MVARDAAGQFEEDRLAVAMNAVAPGRMLLAEAGGGADEGPKPGA